MKKQSPLGLRFGVLSCILLLNTLRAAEDFDYKIAPRDVIQVQIVDEPDSTTVQRVSESGEINTPMIGRVQVAGRTLRQAEDDMTKAFIAGGFFSAPQVIVAIQTYTPKTISVLGQVNRPDKFELPVERDNFRLMQVISWAGGFTRVAKTDEVKVIRVADGKEQQIVVNVAQYLDAKDPNVTDFVLRPDDIVYVKERAF